MDYTKLAELSSKVLSDFGVPMEFTPATLTRDPATGSEVNQKVGPVVVNGVTTEYSFQEVQTGLALRSDRRVFTEPSDNLQVGYVTLIDGVKYRVISINKIKPADVTILLDIQCRM